MFACCEYNQIEYTKMVQMAILVPCVYIYSSKMKHKRMAKESSVSRKEMITEESSEP
jgi:hypothetical protein